MKTNTETNSLDNVISTMINALTLVHPLTPNAEWNKSITMLLNDILKNLYAEDLPFIFTTQDDKKNTYLKISPSMKPLPDKDEIHTTIARLNETLLEIKQRVLTESAWQLLSGLDSYRLIGLPPDIVVNLLKLCTQQSGENNKITTNLLRNQFGFNSIYLPDEITVLRDLDAKYAELTRLCQTGGFKNDEMVKEQLLLCDQILNKTSDRPTARMLHSYYQFARASIHLQIEMNKVFDCKQLTTAEAILIKQNLEKIKTTYMSFSITEFDEKVIPLVIESLVTITTCNPLAITEAEINQCENDTIRRNLFSLNRYNIDLLQEIFEKFIEHCKFCISSKDFVRLDFICSKLKKRFSTCLKDLAKSSIPEKSSISNRLSTMLDDMDKLVTPPSRSWQSKTTPIQEEDGLELMRATFAMNRRFGYGSKPVMLDDLCQLASEGEYTQLKLLISPGTDAKDSISSVETCSTANLSLLQYAVAHNRTETVKLLLKNKANPNREDDNGVTPMMWMIKCNQSFAHLEMLLNHGAPVNGLNSQGYTPLHFAAFFGKCKAVEFLLDNQAEINQKIEKAKTKLTRAKTKSKVSEKIPYYNLDKTLPHMIDLPIEGDTALHIALKRGEAKMATLLLEKGADANLSTKNGVLPLALAAQHTPAAIPVLISKGGKLIEAVLSSKASLAKITQYLYETKQHALLIECIHAKPSLATENFDDGNTLLHHVIRNSLSSDHDKELMQLIIAQCAKMDCDKRNKQNQKAIFIAIEAGIEDALICTLAQHTELALLKKDSHSVLELCLNHNRSNKLIRFLLEHGACANDHLIHSEHPLLLAIKQQNQNTELLTLLLDHGAWLDSNKTIAELLALAKAHEVDVSVLNRIETKIAAQKTAAAEKAQRSRPMVELLEPRQVSKSKNTHDAARQTEIELDWDRAACWDATGNRWEKGGKPDDSFYLQMQTFFSSGRDEGLTRDQIITQQLKGYSRPKKTTAPKLEKVKAVAKKTTAVVADTPISEYKPQPPSAAVPVKKLFRPVVRHDIEPTIDWSEPAETKNKKKTKGKKGNSAKQPEATANEILPIQLADNEALFLEDMCTWRSTIEKPTQLHDEICEDVRRFSLFLIFLGISAADELLNIDLMHGEHNNNAFKQSIFTADDAHAQRLRNNIMHNFPNDELLISTYDNIIRKNLGPRLRAYQKSKTICQDLPSVDLSKGALYSCQMAEINVNERILELFRRITHYAAALEKEYSRQILAFKLLDQQNHAKPVFIGGQIDFTHVDVYTARAIESCLVWLGKLHTLYIEQNPKLKILPFAMTSFMADVYKNIRNIFAHQVGDNAQWHYSPIDVRFIQENMKLAVDIFRAYKSELAQQVVAAPAPQNRFRLVFDAQPFVPNGNNNNNTEATKAKWNLSANAFVPKK